MPASCKCCTNTESAELNKRIASGGTNRSIAERFKVSTMSVQRHRTNCLRLPGRIEKKAAPFAPVDVAGTERNGRCAACGVDASAPDQTALLRRAERLLWHAEAIIGKAVTDGDSRLVLMGLDRARASMELMMKATGLIGSDGTSINVDARRQTGELFAKLSIGELRALAHGKAFDGSIDSEATRGAGTALAVPVDS